MLILEMPKPDVPPIVIFESDKEYIIAAEAVQGINPDLAQQLGQIATLVHDEGLLPDSTHLEGNAAVEVMHGLGELARHNVFADLVLQSATHEQADVDELAVLRGDWPEDIVAHINSLDPGPQSADVSPGKTGMFKPEAEYRNDEIAQREAQKARMITELNREYYPKLIATHRVPDAIE